VNRIDSIGSAVLWLATIGFFLWLACVNAPQPDCAALCSRQHSAECHGMSRCLERCVGPRQ
jgi:hypothetical protein